MNDDKPDAKAKPETKRFDVVHFKALDGSDDEPGTFEAIINTGHIDHYGDKVMAGAFTDDLAKAFAPIVWTHQWDIVPIGVTMESYETEHEGMNALYAKARLFVRADEDHEVARQVYTAMKAVDGKGMPALRQFSFSYDIIESRGWVVEDEVEFYSLDKLHVIEQGPCLKGVNRNTALLGVKSDDERVTDEPVRPPRPSEKASAPEGGEKGNPPANPSDDGEEPEARTLSKAYLDVRYAR